MYDIFYLGPKPNLFAHEKPATSIADAQSQSRTRYCWIVNYLCDYTGFDFLYEPVVWESSQAHVWPSQHQENSGTWLVPKQAYTEVNRNHTVVYRKKHPPIVLVEHGNQHNITCYDYKTRYIADYLGTIRRALRDIDSDYVWIISSVCDYSEFDFTWHPSEWQDVMLHVFPSNEQKFGDTFYVPVQEFLAKTKKLELLEWFETIHFVGDIPVPRLPAPTVQYTNGSVVPAIWNYEFTAPVVQFYRYNPAKSTPTIPLWRERTKTVTPLATGSECVLVPREAKNHLCTQVYDYPWVDRTHADNQSQPLDIVFISNGESNAERNWQHLLSCTQHVTNRVVRVDQINGRVAAYQAALRASNTDWAFCVFAKLEVDPEFDWSWQPDRLQVDKHYIFHALNPVNGLEYGHMAMIAYHKQLVLSNDGTKGLDFTLDQEHEVIPIRSGIARYADDPWIAWRSAFRECIKLKASLPNIESAYRLRRWRSQDNTNAISHWSTVGAEDAIKYYDQVNGKLDQLKLTYEWSWLTDYFKSQHQLTPDQLCTQLRNQ